jgi:hypothetical protein
MKRYWVVVLYGVIGFALYGASLCYGFILDDEFQILSNPQVRQLSNLFQNFTNSTVATGQGMTGVYYKPVMMMSYNLIWNFSGGNPAAFHLCQLLLHIANAFLIFLLFESFFHGVKRYGPFLAGLLFLCHPANSEAVVMIADLQETLFLFFGLSALLVLTRTRSPRASAILFLLSLLSKESGVLFVLIAPAYCYWMKKDLFKVATGSVFAALLGYFGLRLGLAGLSTVHAQNMQINRADFWIRLQTLPKILAHYLHLFLSIEGPSLTQDWVVESMNGADFWVPLVQVVAVLGASILVLVKRPRKELCVLFVWLGIGLGLHSQIVPLDGTVSDRWLYFPIIAAIGICLWVISDLLHGAPKIKFSVLGLIVLGLSAQTFARTQNWVSAKELFLHDLQSQPRSFYLNNNVGLELLNEKKYSESVPYFETTIAVSPVGSHECLVGWRNLGAAHMELKDYIKAEKCFRNALADPDVRSYRAMVMILTAQGRHEEAKSFLELALSKFPDDPVLMRFKPQPVTGDK